MEKKIECFFISALVKEVDKRLEDNNVLCVQGDIPQNVEIEKPRMISLKDTIEIERTPEYEALSLAEKDAKFLQTIMRRKGDYVSLEDINTIWNDILKNHKIVIKTGVKYRHREEADTYYSSMDSLFFVNSFRVKEYKTGVLDEFTFQGHYKLTFPAVFNHSPKKFMLLMFLGIIFLAGLLTSGYFIVERSNLDISDIIPPPKPEEAEYLRIKKANCYPLNEMVTFDVDRGMLFTEDGREVLLKPLMVQLFMEFVLSPYYYALNTDLWRKLWDREEDPSNVLTQLISRTREEIDLIDEVEIRNIPRSGYRMVIYSKGEPRTKESEELRQETVKKKKNKPSSKRVR